MPYVKDQHGNDIVDSTSQKIQFTVSHEKTNFVYKHKEPIHVDDNGHINTEDRYIVIKDGVDPDHAVSKSQLGNLDTQLSLAINNLKTQLTADLQALEAKIVVEMLNFSNDQVKNRIQRKYLTTPKTVHTFIKLFDYTDVGDRATDLRNVIILNVWIRRYGRYHHAKSALVEKDFNNSIEFFYDKNMQIYHTFCVCPKSLEHELYCRMVENTSADLKQ